MNEGSHTGRFALFRDGKQISKAHSTRHAAVMDAYTHGAMLRVSPDFPGDRQ
jgi:hypothetical protein